MHVVNLWYIFRDLITFTEETKKSNESPGTFTPRKKKKSKSGAYFSFPSLPPPQGENNDPLLRLSGKLITITAKEVREQGEEEDEEEEEMKDREKRENRAFMPTLYVFSSIKLSREGGREGMISL